MITYKHVLVLSGFLFIALPARADTSVRPCEPGYPDLDQLGMACGRPMVCAAGPHGMECRDSETKNYKSCSALVEDKARFEKWGACELDARYTVNLSFLSYADCVSKWNRQLAVEGAKAEFAGFDPNEKAAVVCKRLFPYATN
jgi:hypothetical protein